MADKHIPQTTSTLLDPALEKSRARSNAARATQDHAERQAEGRQLLLVTNEARIRARQQAIEQTERRLKEDRKALKKLQAQLPALQKKLKQAKLDVETSAKQARKLEAKYDDAVLRHVVEREKSVDRAIHAV